MFTVEGYLGGKLFIADDGSMTAFFVERFMTGCPCEVPLGKIVDDLLVLEPGDNLDIPIDGIDLIYACHAPKQLALDHDEVVLYFLSTCNKPTNLLIVSQEGLRQAVYPVGMAA